MKNSQKFRAGTKHAVPVPRVLWHGSYRTHRSSGYGYGGRTELPELLGTATKVLQNIQNFRGLRHGRTELPEDPGRYKHAVPVLRVFVAPACRTSRNSGYGYEFPTEFTQFFCRVISGVKTPGMVLCVPYRQNQNRKFAYGYECRTEITAVPGTGRVVQNSQKFRVRVIPG